MNHGKNIFQWYVYITIRSCAKAYGRGLGQRTNIVCFLWWKMYIYALCGKLNNAHSLIGSYQWSNQGQTHHWQFLAYLLNKTNRFHVDVVCSLIDHGRHQWHSWLCLMWYFFVLAAFWWFFASHLYSWWQEALRNNRIILFGALTKQNQQSTENLCANLDALFCIPR